MLTVFLKMRLLCFLLLCISTMLACSSKKGGAGHLASSPDELQDQKSALLRQMIPAAYAASAGGTDSTVALMDAALAKAFYIQKEFVPQWSFEEHWLPVADSLYRFIENSRYTGLIPSDYHLQTLQTIRDRLLADSQSRGDRRDASLWARADLLLTDAFFRIVKDIKLGRLPQDSISLRPDSVLHESFYLQQWEQLQQAGISRVVASLEPSHEGYHQLKAALRNFLQQAGNKQYSRVPYPEKNTALFNRALQRRLFEGGYLPSDSIPVDSSSLAAAVKKFQQEKGLAADGRAGEATVRMLNVNDEEKFFRVAISLDKYKMLPPQMPSRYIWVNTAANMLELVENGTVRLQSRVICGKSRTSTPQLNSAISELITYPQWVPPPSIVSKEILPAVKRNPGYLARKGFSLVDSKGNEVDPYAVDWARYSKGIPYRVVQGSGDANALGIMKFVFSNKYSVYLHDTNQRYLFANAMRSLSHGCVRVQEWEKLAYAILSMDNAGSRADSVKTWLQKKQKRSIPIRNKLPLFIRYITCGVENGQVAFYDDVYGEDKMLREKYYAGK